MIVVSGTFEHEHPSTNKIILKKLKRMWQVEANVAASGSAPQQAEAAPSAATVC